MPSAATTDLAHSSKPRWSKMMPTMASATLTLELSRACCCSGPRLFRPGWPTCGAPLPIKNRFVRMTTCDFCQNVSLLVGGKLEVAKLGEFCCSSRPLRAGNG